MDDAHVQPPGPAWAAPAAAGPVRARLAIPGSKSETNRALVLAALAGGPGTIRHPLRARDTLLMRAALTALGATISDATGPDKLHYAPDGAPESPGWQVAPGQPTADTSVHVGNAGTVMRFAPPVAALSPVSVAFHGDPRASQRPVAPVLAALRELGAVIDDGGRGAIPFTVHGTGSLPGGVVTLDASGSSQLVSGLLLAAPRFDHGVEVRHSGPPVPSLPHIEMTVRMLRDAGATVEVGAGERPDHWVVRPGRLHHRYPPRYRCAAAPNRRSAHCRGRCRRQEFLCPRRSR